MKCKFCGSPNFIGHQIIRADILVNGETGDFEEDLDGGLQNHVNDTEAPYGEFTCPICGAVYEALEDDAKVYEGPDAHMLVIDGRPCTSDDVDRALELVKEKKPHLASRENAYRALVRCANIDGTDSVEAIIDKWLSSSTPAADIGADTAHIDTNICPFCGEDVEFDETEYDSEGGVEEWHCPSCGHGGKNILFAPQFAKHMELN